MHATMQKLLQELKGAWRFRRWALTVAWGVCLFGWLVVYVIPDTYESHARVNVDTRTALRPLLQGIAVEPDVETQLNLVRQTLMGRANLDKVASRVGLDATVTSPSERDAVLQRLTERLTIALEPPTVRDPRIPNTLYRITYTNSSRDTALKVVDVLLNSFVEGTMGTEQSSTASAERFLREQLTDYDRRLAEAESRLADFKKRNVGLVPGTEGDYFQRLTTEMHEVKRAESSLSTAVNRRAELQRQLRGEAPFVPPTDPALAPRGNAGNGQQPQDTASRIQETQARLDDLLLRFTDKHPDVIAARETLDQLRARQKEEVEALKRGDAGAAAVAGAHTNPVYQSIQLQLNQVEVEIAALRGQLAEHQGNVTELRRLVNTAPEVEADYARLTRDYGVTKAQYDALLERLERAKLSGDAEATGVVKFNIVDPPSVTFQPIFPNRVLFIIGILIAALALGAGVAFLLHMMKPVFSSVRALTELTGLPVLGSVTRTWVEKQRAELKAGLLRYSAASGLLVVLFGVVLFFQEPGSRWLRQLIG